MTNSHGPGGGIGGGQVAGSTGIVLLFFLLAIVFHIFDIITKFSLPHFWRGLFYFLFGLFAAFLLFHDMERYRAIELCLGISAIVFFLPWILAILEGGFFGILDQLPLRDILDLEVVSWLIILIPVWPLVIGVRFFDESPRPVRWFIILYFILLFVWFLYMAVTTQPWLFDSLQLQSLPDIEQEARGLLGDIQQGFQQAAKSFRSATERQIKYAAGDYYTGQVDKNAEEPLGVYIEKVQPASPFFYAGETAIVWGTLKARTIEQDVPLRIAVMCNGTTGEMTKGNPNLVPPIPPQPIAKRGNTSLSPYNRYVKEFVVDDYEYADLSCQFDPGTFLKGSREASFFAQFEFETHSYQKGYFMNLQQLRALRQQNIDPFGQFEVKDKAPKTVYSNGPIEIGMGLRQPLIGIEEGAEFRLSGSLKNRWKGKIFAITDLIIKVPPGMEIVEDSCTVRLEKIECTSAYNEVCEYGKYPYFYHITQESDVQYTSKTESFVTPFEVINKTVITENIIRRGLEHMQGKHIEGASHVPFSCDVRVVHPAEVLGGVPFSTQYFKVSAEYRYELEKSTYLTIKETPGVVVE
ncbi:hypothetical protein HYS47_00045 [Candidatus Woesearchaeota archaeon]|nr:hypothetical protein [Candidatus Woesearchaeota archaeon]